MKNQKCLFKKKPTTNKQNKNKQKHFQGFQIKTKYHFSNYPVFICMLFDISNKN